MRIYVQVIPKSSRKEITKISEGEYKARLTAPPEKGKANRMLVEMLADYFNIAKNSIEIIGGKTAKIKIIDIGD